MQTVVELLKSSALLRKVPDEKLAALGEKLKPVPLGDGAVLFEEGSQGKGMYFVSEGRIRISKKAAGGASKDLAILAAGECFGEMELVGGAARSASASAVGATVVFELQRDDMNGWLAANPEQGLNVYSELAQIQTTRLRRTSDELALLFDLSNLILERHKTAKELLGKALAYIAPHLEGEWSAAAFLHNPYSEETEQAAVFGGLDAAAFAGRLPGPKVRADDWLDERSFYAVLPGEKAPWGFLLFQSNTAQPEQQRRNTSRVLAAAARLLAAAVENINFQTEEALRARLKSQTYGTGI
jgi:CRP-like cAMP-binding protein